ncbi:MFS transporter [Nocardioides pakistanensis]
MSRPPRGVLATLSLTVTISYGTLYYAFAVLAPDITRDTGWSLTAITAAFSLGSAMTALAGIAAGRMIQSRGPRPVMVAGGVVGSAGLLVVAAAPAYLWFVAGMLLCGTGAAGLFYAPAFAAITHWHGPRRVQALTTLTLVAGFASTIFAPVTTALADQTSWRGVYVIYAGLLMATAVPLHAIVLGHPWPADGGHAHRGRDRAVLASQTFVLVAIAGTLVTLAMYASLIALIPLLIERGMTPAIAAWALGLGGAGQVAGRLLYPRLARVLPVRTRVTLVTGAMALTLAALAAIPGPHLLLLGVSILAGAARGLYTLVGATLVTDLWGPERYAAINGTLTAPMAAAVAIGPFLGAWIAQAAGGYGTTFVVLAALAGLGTLLFARAVGHTATAPGRTSPAARSA